MTVSELESTVTKQDVHISKMEEAVENAEWDVKSFITAQQARYCSHNLLLLSFIFQNIYKTI